MNKHAALAIDALKKQTRVDDLHRARHVFRNATPTEMQSVYGFSGKTRQQLLDEFEEHEREINAAIEWVATMGEGG